MSINNKCRERTTRPYLLYAKLTLGLLAFLVSYTASPCETREAHDDRVVSVQAEGSSRFGGSMVFTHYSPAFRGRGARLA